MGSFINGFANPQQVVNGDGTNDDGTQSTPTFAQRWAGGRQALAEGSKDYTADANKAKALRQVVKAYADDEPDDDKAEQIVAKSHTLDLAGLEGMVTAHANALSQQKQAADIARDVDDLPLAAIIYTDIARDGMLEGPNVAATERMLMVCKKVPIVHSGGVTTLADVTALKTLAIQGIIVGRALYEGTLKVEEAVKELRVKNSEW